MNLLGAVLLLVGVTLVLSALSEPQIQYQEITDQIVGDAMELYAVSNVYECAHKAFFANLPAFRIVETAEGKLIQCLGYTMIKSFWPAANEAVSAHFLADMRANKGVCSSGMETVDEIIAETPKCGSSLQICEALKKLKSTRPSCRAGFTYLEIFQKCLGVFPIPKAEPYTQERINNICFDRNASPATVENDYQNQAISDRSTGYGVVIGFQTPKEQPWSNERMVWVDGSKSPYRNWGKGLPKADSPYFLSMPRMAVLATDHNGNNWTDLFPEYISPRGGSIACTADPLNN